MALPIIRESRRVDDTFGEEGLGLFDRLWNEWTRWWENWCLPSISMKGRKYYITAEIWS
jgi:hypothetical protein